MTTELLYYIVVPSVLLFALSILVFAYIRKNKEIESILKRMEEDYKKDKEYKRQVKNLKAQKKYFQEKFKDIHTGLGLLINNGVIMFNNPETMELLECQKGYIPAFVKHILFPNQKCK